MAARDEPAHRLVGDALDTRVAVGKQELVDAEDPERVRHGLPPRRREELLVQGGHSRVARPDIELGLGPAAARAPHGGAAVRAPENPDDRVGERRGVAGRHEPARHAVLHGLGEPPDVRRDHGKPRRHGLENGERQALGLGGEKEEVGRRENGVDVVAEPREDDVPGRAALACEDPELRRDRAVAHEQEPEAAHALTHARGRRDRRGLPLPGAEPPDDRRHDVAGRKTERPARRRPVRQPREALRGRRRS